jgi:hypothetical protein
VLFSESNFSVRCSEEGLDASPGNTGSRIYFSDPIYMQDGKAVRTGIAKHPEK